MATGCDQVFITTNSSLVEESRLLPLALAADTTTGHLKWSGHFLVNPWEAHGLIELQQFPCLQDYFRKNQLELKKRHVAKKREISWFRTIDRVNHKLLHATKLYVPDIKDRLNPVLDSGGTYPHHNLYFIESEGWDLEVLGGILLSEIAQLFVECYGVRMRGGYLRFQAQYLRRIRVPKPEAIAPEQAQELVQAFRLRDRQQATRVAVILYGVEPHELEDSCEP